jgi:hypothetical protein
MVSVIVVVEIIKYECHVAFEVPSFNSNSHEIKNQEYLFDII